MITLTPYKIPYYNQKQKTEALSFSKDLSIKQPTPTTLSTFDDSFNPSWIKDENIHKAVNNLNYLKFDKKDIKTIEKLGVILPFSSGAEALKFIKSSNIRIKFDTFESNDIHARYDFDNNCIKINEIYKNTKNPAEILAISEAILHEAGHAKDLDGDSSIQEELDCLALNALSHRAFKKQFPDVKFDEDSLIVKDGVCVYADLFFDEDSTKSNLINRLKNKYGTLPTGDFIHPPSNLAFKIKS